MIKDNFFLCNYQHTSKGWEFSSIQDFHLTICKIIQPLPKTESNVSLEYYLLYTRPSKVYRGHLKRESQICREKYEAQTLKQNFSHKQGYTHFKHKMCSQHYQHKMLWTNVQTQILLSKHIKLWCLDQNFWQKI